MNTKTQMRIGLWGAVFIIGLGIHHFFSELPYLSYPDFLICVAFPMLLFVIYIFSILSKNLKMVKIIYRTWLYIAVIFVCFIAFTEIMTILGFIPHGIPYLMSDMILFLFALVLIGFITLVLWTGVRGLRGIVETESKLNVENTFEQDKSRWLIKNKKQLISMWCGIIAIMIWFPFLLIYSYYDYYLTPIEILICFFIGVFLICIVTTGFIIAFRSKGSQGTS
jgi:hypothetical protein